MVGVISIREKKSYTSLLVSSLTEFKEKIRLLREGECLPFPPIGWNNDPKPHSLSSVPLPYGVPA